MGMKTAEIRERFLKFFEQKQHQRVASSSLIPGDDPTLLFTNAGMVPFKDTFLGVEKRDYVRATSSQRCVRAGGKHNDLENVGYTARHHTFFEMLGNFSFGDYFKRDAIEFAWEFLTKELALPEEKLWVTVFDEDQEAEDIWLKDMGVSPERFSRIGAKDNFWSMGDVGPCGPCSEIFYDHGEEVAGGPPGSPEEDGDRYIEIWNLVFMQYNRSKGGELKPLPKPSVDTGMGLERIAAVMQNVHNNYEIDLFDNLIKDICQVIAVKDKTHHSVRVVADHIRACSFLIADGVLPSNEGRGYVLRRIIRRAIRHGNQLGAKTPFFHKLVASLAREMGDAYPELEKNKHTIEEALKKEELRFAETLEQGLKIFEQKTAGLKSKVVPGDLAFLLYDTYGFPVDLTADVARERGMSVDMEKFESAMQEQRDRARSSSQFDAQEIPTVDIDCVSEFVGYTELENQAKVVSIVVNNNEVDFISEGQQGVVVLDTTPFYAESGGQIGDKGIIGSESAVLEVTDCQKLANNAILHFVSVTKGQLKLNEKVSAQVQNEDRAAIAANHSATHLMHAALKKVLGQHVSQKGSLVTAEKFRFDFSHSEPVSKQQILEIEALVNEEVFANRIVTTENMAIDKAKAAGAEALFGEKYGDEVRVVSMGEFSLELCGGTHVNSTGEIGLFKIVSETGVASGVRRIEAVTRRGAYDWVAQQNELITNSAVLLKTVPEQLLKRIEQLQSHVKTLEKDKQKLQQSLASGGGSNDLEQQVQEVSGVQLLAVRMDGVDSDILRQTIDKYRDKLTQGIVVLGAEVDGKVRLIAGVNKSITNKYKAGDLIKHITAIADGRGGGRPDMAEGGIPDISKLDMCLKAVEEWVQQQS